DLVNKRRQSPKKVDCQSLQCRGENTRRCFLPFLVAKSLFPIRIPKSKVHLFRALPTQIFQNLHQKLCTEIILLIDWVVSNVAAIEDSAVKAPHPERARLVGKIQNVRAQPSSLRFELEPV